jgi:hypothetical protein
MDVDDDDADDDDAICIGDAKSGDGGRGRPSDRLLISNRLTLAGWKVDASSSICRRSTLSPDFARLALCQCCGMFAILLISIVVVVSMKQVQPVSCP